MYQIFKSQHGLLTSPSIFTMRLLLMCIDTLIHWNKRLLFLEGFTYITYSSIYFCSMQMSKHLCLFWMEIILLNETINKKSENLTQILALTLSSQLKTMWKDSYNC